MYHDTQSVMGFGQDPFITLRVPGGAINRNITALNGYLGILEYQAGVLMSAARAMRSGSRVAPTNLQSAMGFIAQYGNFALQTYPAALSEGLGQRTSGTFSPRAVIPRAVA